MSVAREKHLSRPSHRPAPLTADHMIAETASISNARQMSHRQKSLCLKKCKGCDSASKIIEAYAKGFEDGAEAVKKMPQTEYERASEQREHDILYEPTYNPEDGSM